MKMECALKISENSKFNVSGMSSDGKAHLVNCACTCCEIRKHSKVTSLIICLC
jgi:hypothetical protein